MGSVLPPTSAFPYEVDEYMYEYNPEKARELLEEYAAEKGLTLPLTTMSAFKCTDEQLEIGCTDLVEAPITVTTTTSAANVARAEFEAAAYNAVGFEVTMNLGEGKEGPRTFVTKEASFSLSWVRCTTPSGRKHGLLHGLRWLLEQRFLRYL
ncbi:MAG: hypothetical protein CM1200mP39_28770 [Dehalococcoidia bacterium]|nr:MAG: hypothetical protein CM1200mP39_28770 [Dehalococcoidia bacterium]